MKTLFQAALLSLVTTSAMATESVVIEHRMGKTEIQGVPERVVVIGLGSLDAINALGIDPVAVSKTLPQVPAYLEKYKDDKYANVGSLFEPNFEEIYNQNPDIIIVGPRSSPSFDELSKIAPTVVFAADSSKGYWNATQEQWRNLGKVFGKEELVEEKIAAMDKEFKAINSYNQTNGVDALTIMSAGGKLSSFGADSRFSAIYTDFGFNESVKGIKASNHGDMISFEFIRESDPKTLLVIDRDTLINPAESETREQFDNDLIKATQAYQNNKMTYLDLNAWYLSMSGITATEQMISDIKNSVDL
ncbi:Ferric vibriobactin, enterobactin transport system, substrate-binding protein VctP [Grimontia indica]|uniref:Ferric vibriobactin, enterobactin transport system, substrate-binding protein VctP n=1 Tax=Grimontia indica TaxID=1056512 RepID=R1GVE8_9GAMM|nr:MULTISPECIES: siderophore ABC transporter substrate-binding protein [Grimontia]EOD79979.1 Ferric vibriobactin, enterobactin transport system, substrate-binding protein VctP [Grimontia indica]